jgi:L-serine dehydratase
MRAAARFAGEACRLHPHRIQVELFGSLGLTGKGHGTHLAVISGLSGEVPESIDPATMIPRYEDLESSGALTLPDGRTIPFNLKKDLIFNRRKSLPFHPNGMELKAFDKAGDCCLSKTLYSVEVAYPFASGAELLDRAGTTGLSLCQILLENESIWRPVEETEQRLDAIWSAMQACVQKGLMAEGHLPGGLKVPKRAPGLYRKLCDRPESALKDSLTILDWVNVYAIAVNEENASGGRVVTAPTNGAAGIIPAVMHYCDRFASSPDKHWHRSFLLTAGAIGLLFKENASISGADVGCQGEVGVACSMAAGALAEFLGGTPQQVENAAEIGMEHNLGLTCDPIGGLVQIPCIERNAMGAVKAINAARIALRGDGQHSVSLDAVIKTMRDTGKDMRRKYKETSKGGLAVNVVEC